VAISSAIGNAPARDLLESATAAYTADDGPIGFRAPAKLAPAVLPVPYVRKESRH
jgi:hypothetical protein